MNRIAVWDADFVPFYVCHNKEGIEKSLEECIANCDSIIETINKAIGSTDFIGFLTQGKCFRYKIYPSYKANRKYTQMPKYLNEVRQYMIDHYGFTSNPEYEADDLVISYKNQSKDDCIIVSPDKDILNTRGTHYNPRKNQFVTTGKEEANVYFWKSMIIGDSTDNIKGIRGIGPAGAEKVTKGHTVFSSLRAAVLDKYCEVLGEDDGIEQFYINYKCLKIVDNIPFDNKQNNIELICEQKKED